MPGGASVSVAFYQNETEIKLLWLFAKLCLKIPWTFQPTTSWTIRWEPNRFQLQGQHVKHAVMPREIRAEVSAANQGVRGQNGRVGAARCEVTPELTPPTVYSADVHTLKDLAQTTQIIVFHTHLVGLNLWKQQVWKRPQPRPADQTEDQIKKIIWVHIF